MEDIALPILCLVMPTEEDSDTSDSSEQGNSSKYAEPLLEHPFSDSGDSITEALLIATQQPETSLRPTERSQLATPSAPTKAKDRLDIVHPRSHHLYGTPPGTDGLFQCPFAEASGCGHKPTKLKYSFE
jgi:hypothetical protein